MGSGIDAARELAPEHAQALENMRDQLLIVFVNRLGGDVVVPVAEIDGTGQYVVEIMLDPVARKFRFVSRKKS